MRLLVAANAVYQGVAVFDGKTIVQMKSEEWSGEFIDVEDTDVIPDKAIVRVYSRVGKLLSTPLLVATPITPFFSRILPVSGQGRLHVQLRSTRYLVS